VQPYFKKGICIHHHIRKSSKKVGLPPGTPVYVGKTREEQIKITFIEYDSFTLVEKQLESSSECFPKPETGSSTWINVDGVHNPDVIQKIGEQFQIHPLVLEDIMNTGQRPKAEDFENYLYIILKMLHFDEQLNETKTEQVSLVFGSNYLISFQETEGDVFNPIRERLKSNRGKIRKMGVDYLGVFFDRCSC
jgi:magnesium transporter